MTPEEEISKVIDETHLRYQLQAETQRADKAEEIVEGFKQGGIKDVINIYESRIKELQLRVHQEQTKFEYL